MGPFDPLSLSKTLSKTDPCAHVDGARAGSHKSCVIRLLRGKQGI